MGFNLTLKKNDVSVDIHMRDERDDRVKSNGFDTFVTVGFEIWDHNISPCSLKQSTAYLTLGQAEYLYDLLGKSIKDSHRLNEKLICEDCGAEEIETIGEVEVCGNCRATESAIPG